MGMPPTEGSRANLGRLAAVTTACQGLKESRPSAGFMEDCELSAAVTEFCGAF